MTTEELRAVKIKTLAEGHDLIEQIEDAMAVCLRTMQSGVSNEEHARLSNARYDYKTIRHDIRNQMQKLVKENRNVKTRI